MGFVHLDADSVRPGTALGPYDLLAPVGSGGMARVWAAAVRATGQIVALKMALPELVETPSFRKMFFDEASIASRVRHPNVCATFELGEIEAVLYIAMEWVDGASLMRVLRPNGDERDSDSPRFPIHPRLAARIVADACAGLQAAHDLTDERGQPLGVVHRDASPHNILLATDGQIKVTDFGVAKALGNTHMTVAGQLKGKLSYMAPEQLTGGGVDRRTDVFALGIVLYEITTGRRPFVGEHDPQVMAAIVTGNYEPPSAVSPGFPRELESIIVRALGNERSQRFQSAAQLKEGLEAYLRASGPPVTAAHVSALLHERCGREIDRRFETIRAGALVASTPAAAVHAPVGRSTDTGPVRVRPRSSAGFVVAAVLGIALGLGVLGWIHKTRRPQSLAPSSELPPYPSARVATAVTAPPSPGATTSGTSTVRLHVIPAGATLVVDGIPLPRGSTTLARPEDGGATTVLVRAENYRDTLVVIGRGTPEDIEVVLDAAPADASAPAPVARPFVPGGSPRPTGAASVATAGQGPSKEPTAETPPNPYD